MLFRSLDRHRLPGDGGLVNRRLPANHVAVDRNLLAGTDDDDIAHLHACQRQLDLAANPLDYVEGGPLNARRQQLSEWLDSTNPDLSAFYRRGGKMIVTIGTDDTLASPGAQLDYYQAVLDKMGRDTVDAFARLFVIPQANHGLTGRSYSTNGDGQAMTAFAIPNTYDRLAYLTAWVERNEPPAKTLVVTAGDRSMPLVSYPNYAKYIGGPVD